MLASAIFNMRSAAPGTIFSYPSNMAGGGIGPENLVWISAETDAVELFPLLRAGMLRLFLGDRDFGIAFESAARIF